MRVGQPTGGGFLPALLGIGVAGFITERRRDIVFVFCALTRAHHIYVYTRSRLQMTGLLECGRSMRMDGKFVGDLVSSGSITVGPTGTVTGDLKGLKFLRVEGQVRRGECTVVPACTSESSRNTSTR